MSFTPVHRYVDGKSYRAAKGRNAPVVPFEDLRQFHRLLAVIDLDSETPTAVKFLRLMVREFKIRGFQPKSIKTYRGVLTSFLRWLGIPPHAVVREHVREYLEYLVDGGACGNTLSVHLSAIRAGFDKCCFRDITLGLVTPRKPKKLPVVLSRDEVSRLLQAAGSRRDTLALGLMYATGMRVGELVSVRMRDIDFDGNVIAVRQGKGNVDRLVALPECFRSLLSCIAERRCGDAFLFPSEDRRKGRHLSPRTIQRSMERAVEMAKIRKKATPHSLRHSFATHSFENGCDIRRIQKVLGHVRLETTTIYVKVAKVDESNPITSPLDAGSSCVPAGVRELQSNQNARAEAHQRGSVVRSNRPSVGRLRIHCRQFAGEADVRVTIEIAGFDGPVYFTGTRVREVRRGFWALSFPAEEDWNNRLKKLTSAQQSRFQEPEFYRLLEREVLARAVFARTAH